MITAICIFFVVYLLGYIAGYLNGKRKDSLEALQELSQNTSKAFKKLTTKELQTGVIKSPTAKDIYEKKLDPKIREGKQAMKELLDNSPEIQAHKKALEEFKKKGLNVFN